MVIILTVFVGIFNSEGDVGDKIIDFEGSTSAVSELFSGFGPFEQRQGATIEPLLSRFCRACRHAGLGRPHSALQTRPKAQTEHRTHARRVRSQGHPLDGLGAYAISASCAISLASQSVAEQVFAHPLIDALLDHAILEAVTQAEGGHPAPVCLHLDQAVLAEKFIRSRAPVVIPEIVREQLVAFRAPGIRDSLARSLQ